MQLPPQIGYAVDLSRHQRLADVPWSAMTGRVTHGYVRATYGAELRDELCAAHVASFRVTGARVGCYHFFRISQDVQAQFDAFRAACDAAGIGSGDLPPAVDVEDDPLPSLTNAAPSWSGPAQDFVNKCREHFGCVMLYVTQRDAHLMGNPSWITEDPIALPLWCAHYTDASTPATPSDVVPAFWQHRVAPFVLNGPGGVSSKAGIALDQSRVYRVLETIK